MNTVLILTICTVLSNGLDDCDDYVIESYNSLTPCLQALDANPQHSDTRYLSCGHADTSKLADKRNGRTVAQIIDDVARGAVKAEK